jgi:excisionase family DNA binding protein
MSETERDELALLTVAEAASRLGVRWVNVRELVETGQLRAVKIGSRYRVPASAVRERQYPPEPLPPPPEPPEREYKQGRHSIPLRVRFLVLKRCDFACTYCGRRPPEVVLQIDHILAVANGGTNRPSNLTAACTDCNYGKRCENVDLEVEE